MGTLLQLVGQGADHQIATEAQRWVPAITKLGITDTDFDAVRDARDQHKRVCFSIEPGPPLCTVFPSGDERAGHADYCAGLGFAYHIKATGGSPRENVDIRFEADGTVSLITGTQTIGQGHETTFPQIQSAGAGQPGAARLPRSRPRSGPAAATLTLTERVAPALPRC
jgi:hypothetical protein